MVTFEQFIQKVGAAKSQLDVARIREAYDFAKQQLKGIYRLSGDSMLNHCLVVADNLMSFKPDESSVIAALLHDLYKTPGYDLDKIRAKFGDDVATLVGGMEKLQGVHLKGGKNDLEVFRRMFLSMASDLRLVLIRLADLLHNMETLD